jgi:hypothetical protein
MLDHKQKDKITRTKPKYNQKPKACVHLEINKSIEDILHTNFNVKSVDRKEYL